MYTIHLLNYTWNTIPITSEILIVMVVLLRNVVAVVLFDVVTFVPMVCTSSPIDVLTADSKLLLIT